jgi:integrase
MRMPWRHSKRRGDRTRAGASPSEVNASSKAPPPWGLAKQRAGIEDFRFHDLRHTWASWHVQRGTSLPELMELGGWKSYEMVLRYAHLAPEKLSFVAGRIERQPSKLVDQTLRGENVAKNATLALRSVH